MSPEQHLTFGSYRLDLNSAQLWRGRRLVRLTGKAFGVLRYLVSRPGQLVTKDDLLAAVWPEVVVTETALTKRIQEVRRALGDDPKAPRYIETVHRQGFRFIAPLRNASPRGSQQLNVERPTSLPTPITQHALPYLVGRDAELGQLHSWLDTALNGERQLVFVLGEAGIGKTTIVHAFAGTVRRAEVWIGQGQCIEQYGPGEPYLPILEALERLCREPDGERVIARLRRHAPNWLVQLPAYLSAEERHHLQRETAGTTQPRMLREIAEALEVLTAEKPLLLILEDLQWSDYATVELLAVLARRRERARLVVIGTYRPVDVMVREHPLREMKQELQLHDLCQEVALDFLTKEAVGEYLTARFGTGATPGTRFQDFAQAIHERTDGNPLFMVNVVNDLVRHGVLVEVDGGWVVKQETAELKVGIPDTLHQLIEQQLGRVSPQEIEVLEAASIAGAEFSAAGAAAGIPTRVERVEKHCDALVRRAQFLRAQGTEEWPDGTVAACYGFVHALYHEALSNRVTGARRVGLHQRIGERMEAGYGARVEDIAARLAVHFEEGRDYRRAVQYRHQAGEKAARRHAYQEAIKHLTRGLELLKSLPDVPDRVLQELKLQAALSVALMITKGYGASEVEHSYARARELCQQVGETPQLFGTLRGLSTFYLARAELRTARELGEECLTLARKMRSRTRLMWAHDTLSQVLFGLGEFSLARNHQKRGIALYDPQHDNPFVSRVLQDPKVDCLSFAARVLWFLGYPDQALKSCQEALTLARKLSHPSSLALALDFAAGLHQLRREGQVAQERADVLLALSAEQGFLHFLAVGRMWQGWTLAEQGQVEKGVAQIRRGLATYQASGAELSRPDFLALLVEAQRKGEQVEEGLSLLAEAITLVDKTGARSCEAELYRLKGELLLASADNRPGAKGRSRKRSEAEECFLKAIATARQQQAKSWELRATVSLSRLWQQLSKKKEARQMLRQIYSWFTEGFDTADLKDAKALLDALS